MILGKRIGKFGHSELFSNRQRLFAAFIVEKSRETAYVGEVTTALGEVMPKGPCLAICGRATKISSEAVWRNIYYLTEESPYIWLVSILVICSPPRLVILGCSILILRQSQVFLIGKAHQKNEISIKRYHFKTRLTKSTEDQEYNGSLISLCILYEIRCTDAKYVMHNQQS